MKRLLGERKVIGGPVAPPGRRPNKRGWTVFARSTTIHAQTSSIDDGIAYMRKDLMPELENIDGYVGISLLVDRESGRCIITAAYGTEDAMHASAETAKQLRNRAAETFGGNVEKIEEWEIGLLHRDHHFLEGRRNVSREIADGPIDFAWMKARFNEIPVVDRNRPLAELENTENLAHAVRKPREEGGPQIVKLCVGEIGRHQRNKHAVRSRHVLDAFDSRKPRILNRIE